MSIRDFLPLQGTDHVEFYVGNAKQAAYYYRSAFGFQTLAYSGPETGSKEKVSYVVRQNKLTFMFTTALRPELDTFAQQPAASLVRLHMDPEVPSPFLSDSRMLGSFPDAAVDAFLEQVGPDATSSLLTAELRQLYVLQPWHGTEVARTLMEWVLAEARARGAEQIFLSVFIDNHRARRFYERYGFEAVGTYAFMVGTHADEDIIMRAVL